MSSQKIPTKWWQWWPLLLWIPGSLWVIITEIMEKPELHNKPTQEKIALTLTGCALAASVLHLIISRREMYLLLSALSLAFLFREIHWEWTNKGVYIAIAVIGVWGFLRRKSLIPYADQNPYFRIFLTTAAVTYILSQVVARRALQNIIGDDASISVFLETMHINHPVYGDMEEYLENTAHGLLFITALLGRWRPAGMTKQ